MVAYGTDLELISLGMFEMGHPSCLVWQGGGRATQW